MNPSNPDYQCYLDAVARQRAHQEDWLKVGYAPLGFYLKDFCLHEVGGTWHLYHIAGTPGVSCCLPGNEIWFGHATTKDFVTWETHEPCFFIDPQGWDHGHVFAPLPPSHSLESGPPLRARDGAPKCVAEEPVGEHSVLAGVVVGVKVD